MTRACAGLVLALATALALALAAGPGAAATLRVPSEYPTIQAGLDASVAGDVVLVAPGRYTASESRDLGTGELWTSCAFLSDGVVLRSEGGAQSTAIDMDGATGPQPFVINSRGNTSAGTAVDGFTVTGAPIGGRGAYVVGSLILRNCVFRDMDAGPRVGAGVKAVGDLRVEDCQFMDCVATAGGDAGAIHHASGHLDMTGTTVVRCGPIGVKVTGPERPPPQSSAVIERCEFRGNWADRSGGALWMACVEATVRACTFENNVARGVDYYNGGGAISNSCPGPTIVEGCLFLANRTEGHGTGGAILAGNFGVYQDQLSVIGNTFFGNSQVEGHGGSAGAFFGPTTFERNVVDGSTGRAALHEYLGFELLRSCNLYWNNPEGIGLPLQPTEVEADPLFCAPEMGDFGVLDGSPCAAPSCGQIGAFGVGCTMEAIDPFSWGQLKALYRGSGSH